MGFTLPFSPHNAAPPCAPLRTRHGSGFVLFAVLAFLALLTPSTVHGQQEQFSGVLGQVLNVQDNEQFLGEDRIWRLTADRLDKDDVTQIVEAHGNAVVKSGDDFMRADFARQFLTSNWLYLRGNVRIRWDARYIEAEEAEFDLVNDVGWLKNGRIVTDDPSFFIEGERIRRIDRNTYEFHRATLTTCFGSRPDWSIKVNRAKVTQEDEAQLFGPRLRILNVPVLYSPYLSFSTKTKRSTGILYPSAGTSDRDGFWAHLPVYWALDPEHDLTFDSYLLSKRGLLQGVEWRATPEVDSTLWARIDWLHDRETAPTEADEDSAFRGDGLAQPNSERYWFRSKFDGRLPDPAWRVKLDADYVSDQNFLREFSNTTLNYDYSRLSLFNVFGRDQ
jgi:LPS-assembly protein